MQDRSDVELLREYAARASEAAFAAPRPSTRNNDGIQKQGPKGPNPIASGDAGIRFR